MKHVFSFVAAVMLASAAWAQTTVTLTVDMSNETVSPEGVHVAGNFQGWQAGDTPMTDNGDGTWSYTFTSDSAATYQYKFINGNAWGSDEGIPGACAFDGNRQIEVDGVMGEASSTVCYNSCAACGMTTVRFRVDMSNEEVSPFGVHVAGDFQGWTPDGTELTDADGDMIYEAIESFEADSGSTITFKFINGNAWTDVNELIGEDCGDGTGNRTLTLDSENMVLTANAAGDAYCFNACSSCILPLEVTFTIDMSQVGSVSEFGVHLAGTFQGWQAGDTPLTDNGDGTWSVTLEIQPGYHEFKFINGNDWSNPNESMGGTECSGSNDGNNRGASFDADNNSYECCFNACPGVACVPDPEPANLTFQVDASELELGDTSIYLLGDFTGWQGSAIELTETDGIWQTTQLIQGPATVTYKYSIGYPENDNEESGVYAIGLDTTDFALAGCGLPNPFGSFNRTFVRSGVDEVIPLHCYNSCGACLGDAGCTDDAACNYDETAMTDDGSCTYPGDACDDMDDMTINDMLGEDCVCMGEMLVMGCTDSLACNYDMAANMDDGSCLVIGDTCDDMDDMTINDMVNDSCVCAGDLVIEGCTDEDACNYDMNANVDDGSCEYLDALGECGGDCFADNDGDGICDEEIMLGCTNDMACNYDEMANTDDGSCLVIGEACDDMDEMTIDDTVNDSCECVGTLMVLGCLDSLACNYDMDANTDNESCEYPGDACDDMDENTENDTLNIDCICVGDTIQDSTDFVFDLERLEFGMFPNPTTGEVTLRVDGFHAGVTMQVMDGAGRVVWSEQNLALQGNTVFDLSRLSAGTYNVMLSDERGISVKRLAIQK
ncbi:T9SS type A sorting domain-containing protein [Flavobacteriales bacterium]|nr:T9SS type A sorting domain-containing protein [Flavobacteriales bacterium]